MFLFGSLSSVSAACPIVISGEWGRALVPIPSKDAVIHRDDITSGPTS